MQFLEWQITLFISLVSTAFGAVLGLTLLEIRDWRKRVRNQRKWKNALIAELDGNRFILNTLMKRNKPPERKTISIDKTMDVQAFLPLKTAVFERVSIDILIEHLPPGYIVFIQAVYDLIQRFNNQLMKPVGQKEIQHIRVDLADQLLTDIKEAIKELKTLK